MTKIAAIQMCSSEDVAENLFKAKELITEAAAHKADLVVLPEMFALISRDEKAKLAIQEPYGRGKIQEFLSELAKTLNLWIVAGTIPIMSQNKMKTYATCLIYNNHGKVMDRYDKINLFDVKLSEKEVYAESDTTEAGNKIVVIPTPFGKLGVVVCYDIRFSNLFIELQKRQVEIIAIPAAFTLKTGEAHWQLLARSRAVETFSYLIGACQGGNHKSGRQTYGHSLIVDPWGKMMDEKTEAGNGIVFAEIDLEYLHRIRKAIPIYNSNSCCR